jgi:hypothetical protein
VPISAAFLVNDSPNPAEHIVAFGATVNLALVSIVGADVITWTVLCASEPGYPLPAITPTGTPLGSTATFTMGADPADDIGRSYRVRCTVSNANEIATEDALIGAVNVNGIVPLAPGEELERSRTHGWGPVVNRMGAGGGGGGPTALGGDVTGATSANTVMRIRGATVTVAGAVGTVLQVTGVNALGYALVGLGSITQGGATTGQAIVWNGSTWTVGSPTGTVSPGAANTVLTTNGAGDATAWATIVNANVSASAAIAVSKLASAGAQYQVLTAGVAGAPQWGQVNLASTAAITGLLPIVNIAPGANNTVLITNGSGVVAWSTTLPGTITLAGDVTGASNANVVERVHGATVPIAGALTTGHVLQVSGVSALSYGFIGPGSIDPGAAIQGQALIFNGTAWAPGNDFYARNLITTGTLGAGATTVTGLTISALSTGVLHTNGSGVVSSSFIVNADVDAAAGIVISKLGQSGATTGQAPIWNGTTWVPGAPGIGTGSITPGTAGQILVTLAGPSTAWATAAGDWTGAVGSNVVERINGATVPVAGALTVGHYLVVTGASSLGYAALPPSALQSQNVADIAAMQALPVTPLLDGTSCWVRTLDREYRLKTTAQTAAAANDTYNSATAGRLWMGATT